jgi:O-antigen biosynthesis protein
MTLSVIIVNYNVRQFLENALTSISRALTGIDGEVIVVDNASDDGSAAMVREKFPAVRLIESAGNVGFARANNLALKVAQAEFLLLINPDTIVQEDTFRVMLDFFRAHPETGLAGCRILNPDGSFQLPCRRSFPTPWVAFTKVFGLSTMFPKSRLFGRYNLTYLDPDATYEVDAVSGSFMMLRRAVYEKIGGLDESFFMYGEDLDWCYRVRQAGFAIHYVHATQIIHFKGESTRRSNIDEVRVFYGAMILFVEKHFARSRVAWFFLHLGIGLRGAAAVLARSVRAIAFAVVDALIVMGTIVVAEWLYPGRVFRFPSYAYPIVYLIPAGIVLAVGGIAGLYGSRRGGIRRAAATVIISYVLIAATVFFVKTFAFSRVVALLSGVLAFVLVPGWRIILRLVTGGKAGPAQRRSIFGSRTLIVGTGQSAQEVLRRLRVRVDDGYDVHGFIDTSSARIGDRLGGVEIVGSLENISKVIDERRITDVIFSTDELPYTTILSVIGRSKNRNINFRLVPTSLESIIGKTHIDELDTLPLVEIDYNIRRLRNRALKRAFDILVSGLLLVVGYPFVELPRMTGMLSPGGAIPTTYRKLVAVFRGTISLVGRPEDSGLPVATHAPDMYLGPVGLTGMVQLHAGNVLSPEDREHYELYYAKNQSLLLDVEILSRSIVNAFRK